MQAKRSEGSVFLCSYDTDSIVALVGCRMRIGTEEYNKSSRALLVILMNNNVAYQLLVMRAQIKEPLPCMYFQLYTYSSAWVSLALCPDGKYETIRATRHVHFHRSCKQFSIISMYMTFSIFSQFKGLSLLAKPDSS